MTDAATWIASDDEVRDILRAAKTIALVGASPKPWRDSNGIMAMLCDSGYDVVPVNPNYSEVLGRDCSPDLRSIPVPVDLVNVFRRPSALLSLMEEALLVKAPVVWLQPGAFDEAAARFGAEAGLRIIAERCIGVDHRALVRAPRASRIP